MLASGAYDAPLCTAGCDCEPFFYGVNVTSDAHVALARSIAASSAVLLKNGGANGGGVLPLAPSAVVALVGSACGSEHRINAERDDWTAGAFA